MCNGSIASAAPPVTLPLGTVLTPTVPRADPNGGSGNAKSGGPADAAPRPLPTSPNLGQNLNIAA